jgi:hypothetical protein
MQLEERQLQLRAARMQLEEMQLRADEDEELAAMYLRDEEMEFRALDQELDAAAARVAAQQELEELQLRAAAQLRDERMQLEIMQLRDEKLQLKMENDILWTKLSQCDNLIRSLRHDNRELELRALNMAVVKPCFTATTWTCEMCTLINPHTSRSCQMCGARSTLVKPKSVFSQVSRDDDGKYDT